MALIDPEEQEIRTLDRLVEFKGASVLEIGAGDGRFTWRYAGKAKSVLAFDPADKDVRTALESMPDHLKSRVRFQVADATTFRYPANRFDIAVFSYSL